MPSIKALNMVDTQIVVEQKDEWSNYFLGDSELWTLYIRLYMGSIWMLLIIMKWKLIDFQ